MKVVARLLLLLALMSYMPVQGYTIVIKDKDGNNVAKERREKRKAEKAALKLKDAEETKK